MKRIIIAFFTVLTLSGFQILCAQETEQDVSEIQNETVESVKNVIYFELFGNGGVYSLNYERRITSSIWMRSGFSSLSLFGDYLTVPLTASYVFGSSTVSLETGAGFTFFMVNCQVDYLIPQMKSLVPKKIWVFFLQE